MIDAKCACSRLDTLVRNGTRGPGAYPLREGDSARRVHIVAGPPYEEGESAIRRRRSSEPISRRRHCGRIVSGLTLQVDSASTDVQVRSGVGEGHGR